MDIHTFIKQFGDGKIQRLAANQYNTSPVKYHFIDADIEKFNTLYKYLLESDLHIIERTKSGGIKNIRDNRYAWDIATGNVGLRLTVSIDGYLFVFKIGTMSKQEGKEIQPYKAWNIFVEELEKDNIKIDDYKIDNGLEVKDKIPMPMISFKEFDKVENNVHHIDFHNSYPAGLANTHPEFRTTIERLYEYRREKPEYKAVLNYAIGCMQSKKHPYNCQWAHLAKDAISDNINRVIELSVRLRVSGHKILGYNTDGIWYQGDIYHGDGEGDSLGQWHNDHINCTFRAKSNGAYEFIEDGKYYPVLRGYCKLDMRKDRSKWHWGDIYKTDAEIIKYKFEEGIGIIKDE